jgi:serine/threonine-protein kinase
VGYEALTGRRPFEGDSPVAVAMAHVNSEPPALPQHLPAGARTLIASAMAKDPADRPADAAVFAAAADAAARGDDAAATSMLPATQQLPAAAVAGAGAAAATQVLPTTAPQPAYAPADAAAARPRGQAPRRRRTMTGPLLALLALLLFVALGALFASDLLGGADDPGTSATATTTAAATTSPAQATTTEPRTTTTTTTTTTAEGIVLVEEDYVGRDREDVVDELKELGLEVRDEADRDSEEPRNTVTRVEPSGTPLEPGDEVTVFFSDRKGNGDGDGEGEGGNDGALSTNNDTKDDA